MDLRLVFAAAARHKWMMGFGLLLGIVLGTTTLYTVSLVPGEMRPRFVERSHATYETEVQLMLFDPGFGIGRAGQELDRPDSFRRTVELAPSYAQLLLSEPVLGALVASAGPLDVTIDAGAVEKSPIIKVKVIGSDAERVVQVADGLVGAFGSYMSDTQDDYRVPKYDRMEVRQLASPSPPAVKISRNTEVAVVSLLLPIFAALAVAFAVESFRRSPPEPASAGTETAAAPTPGAAPTHTTAEVAGR